MESVKDFCSATHIYHSHTSHCSLSLSLSLSLSATLPLSLLHSPFLPLFLTLCVPLLSPSSPFSLSHPRSLCLSLFLLYLPVYPTHYLLPSLLSLCLSLHHSFPPILISYIYPITHSLFTHPPPPPPLLCLSLGKLLT